MMHVHYHVVWGPKLLIAEYCAGKVHAETRLGTCTMPEIA